MKLTDIVDFWSSLRAPDSKGHWVHPDDQSTFNAHAHTFNLDYPVSPYIGDILNAPIIVLGLNAGYSAVMTPNEFADGSVTAEYISQVADPGDSPWRLISDYYKTSNSWRFMAKRQVAWINASPYRSPNLSTESANQKLALRLASTKFHNRWIAEAVMPLARTGERLVAVKRKSLWTFLSTAGEVGISPCKSFVGKHLDATVITAMDRFLKDGK